MKLAEALSVRKDLQNKIDQLEDRLKSIVKIQEGDEPDEAAEDLLSELQNAAVQLEDVIYSGDFGAKAPRKPMIISE